MDSSYRQGWATAQTSIEPTVSGVRIKTSILCACLVTMKMTRHTGHELNPLNFFQQTKCSNRSRTREGSATLSASSHKFHVSCLNFVVTKFQLPQSANLLMCFQLFVLFWRHWNVWRLENPPCFYSQCYCYRILPFLNIYSFLKLSFITCLLVTKMSNIRPCLIYLRPRCRF